MGKRIISSKENVFGRRHFPSYIYDHIFNEFMIYAEAIIQIFPFFICGIINMKIIKGGNGRQTHLIGKPAF